MSKPRPPLVRLTQPHPFVRVFPRLSLAASFLGAVLNTLVAVVRTAWPWRRELTLATVLCGTWYELSGPLPTWPALAATVLAAGLLLAEPHARRWLRNWLRAGRTRRLVLAGFTQLRAANVAGQLPRIARITSTPVGERVHLTLRPGQSAELLDTRVEELRAAAKAREVRVTRDPNRSHRVHLDVVRRDPLAATADVVWLDQHTDALSMWDPLHLGVAETGEPVRLSLVERSMLVGGEPGAGKSSLLNIAAAHAAKSPDAHLILIDPNQLQLGPWKDRALAYASDQPDDALAVLELVRAEIRRRLNLLRTLPGVVRKVTPQIATECGLPLWVLIVDELAFHTSVVGTAKQREAFGVAARDIVARCRAAGVIPLMATQRPTSDVVPTSLRDLFSLRCAFRTTTKTSSDVILGDSWARQGYTATDIDLTARGVAWLLAEGHQPQRIKAAWLPDHTIADLSITTIRHRPAIPTPRTNPEVTS